MLHINYGSAVRGEQRFPRPELEGRLIRTFQNSSGIKMFGLRRIGKSTLRLFATEYFTKNNMPHAYIDGQGLQSLNELISKLFGSLPQEKGIMKVALNALTSGPGKLALEALSKGTQCEESLISAYWQTISDAIKGALRKSESKPILVIDEFTYLLSNLIERDPKRGREDVDKLLASMREWRGEGMKMLITGSIGLTGLARKHNLNLEHLNDLQPFAVPELTIAEAEQFISQATEIPSKGAWTPDHTSEFIKQSGVLYPCFLVRGLIEITLDPPPSPGSFVRIFEEIVRPDLHADFYNQFDRRFKDYSGLGKDEWRDLILPALKSVMEGNGRCAQDSISCKDPFSRVDLALALTMLAEDGFIYFSEDSEGTRFWKPASRLAELWWKRSKLV